MSTSHFILFWGEFQTKLQTLLYVLLNTLHTALFLLSETFGNPPSLGHGSRIWRNMEIALDDFQVPFPALTLCSSLVFAFWIDMHVSNALFLDFKRINMENIFCLSM